ncbi:MAG: hypothetical protein WA324_27650 [Bryobacteraceae bacterium]
MKKELTAIEQAFKKAVEESTKKDKDTVKSALFGTNKVKSAKKEYKKDES